MHIDLDSLTSLEDLPGFLAGNPQGTVPGPGRKQACEHVGRVLRRFSYWKLGKADKGLLRRCLARTTGLSRTQLTRLIRRYLRDGELRDRLGRAARPFPRKYTRADILLLAATDELHGSLSGPATLALLKRAWELFGDACYERLAELSNGHLHNLRRSQPYVLRMGRKDPARPSPVAIGELRKPRPQGLPGWVRVDSVHQGAPDKVKGVYHINVVDEVTQYQLSGSVERFSEHFLLPVMGAANSDGTRMTCGHVAAVLLAGCSLAVPASASGDAPSLARPEAGRRLARPLGSAWLAPISPCLDGHEESARPPLVRSSPGAMMTVRTLLYNVPFRLISGLERTDWQIARSRDGKAAGMGDVPHHGRDSRPAEDLPGSGARPAHVPPDRAIPGIGSLGSRRRT